MRDPTTIPHGRTRLREAAMAAAAGIVFAIPLALLTTWALFPLGAWDAAALTYIAWVWLRIWPLDGPRTARLAAREDPTRVVADLLVISAAVASLVAVGFTLAKAASSSGAAQLGLAALGVGSVAVSWLLVHTVYTLRYARLYYTGAAGGIDFNDGAQPGYSDFAYLAFTIGMTFQVSDTDLQTSELRRAALAHALLSFVFVTCIVASTINLVVNLGH